MWKFCNSVRQGRSYKFSGNWRQRTDWLGNPTFAPHFPLRTSLHPLDTFIDLCCAGPAVSGSQQRWPVQKCSAAPRDGARRREGRILWVLSSRCQSGLPEPSPSAPRLHSAPNPRALWVLQAPSPRCLSNMCLAPQMCLEVSAPRQALLEGTTPTRCQQACVTHWVRLKHHLLWEAWVPPRPEAITPSSSGSSLTPHHDPEPSRLGRLAPLTRL